MAKHTAKQKLTLAATERTVTGSRVRHLRAAGTLPAVLYGKGQPSQNIEIPTEEFVKIYTKAGESTLVYLGLGGKDYPTIIKEVAREPISGSPIHADFYAVKLDEKIKAKVPVVFIGESPAVKDLSGIFVRNVNEVEVEALPTDLPYEVTVDISKLANIDDRITLADIHVDNAVIIGQAEDIIATVQAPKSEEELAAELAAPTTAVEEVEEIKKEVPAEEVPAEGEAPAAAPAAPEAK